MFPDLVKHMNGVVFEVLTEPVTINTADGVKVVPGLLSEVRIGGHDFIEADGHEDMLTDWILEFRRGMADASVGDAVTARDMRFVVVDVGEDACGNVRLVLRR